MPERAGQRRNANTDRGERAREGLARWSGRLAGLAGIVLIAVSFVMRVVGRYYLANVSVGTWLLVGVALTAIGCFGLLLAQDSVIRRR
jgi:hypothetical protein